MKKDKLVSEIAKKNKKFFTEFKEFAFKGNVIDMAVGVIIASAFGKIVSALVTNIFMPFIGILIGGINVKELELHIFGNVTIQYGIFLQDIIEFIIIALAIFLFVKLIEKIMPTKKDETEVEENIAEEVSDEVLLLTEIRDLLKEQKE